MKVRRLGIVTAGGDCPGMNGSLRAIVKAAELEDGIEVVGFQDGFAGLLADQSRPLGFDEVSGILVQAGTILGASKTLELPGPTRLRRGRLYETRTPRRLTEARRIIDGWEQGDVLVPKEGRRRNSDADIHGAGVLHEYGVG